MRTRVWVALGAVLLAPAVVLAAAGGASRGAWPALAATLGVALLVGTLLARRVSGRVRRVRRTVEALGSGDLSARVRTTEARGEPGALARALNETAERLQSTVAALSAERDDLDALFESLDDGLAVIDGEGLVTRANPAFARWTGRGVVTGERIATLFRSPDLTAAVERGLSGRSHSREARVGDRTALVAVQPHREGALVMIHDLTRLRRLEGVRRDFVANVSHELKTPLTSVVGFAEAVASGEPTAEQARRFGERILANARRMRRLVDELLDLARIESGNWEPQREKVDLAGTARGVWGSLQPEPERRAVSLTVSGSAVQAAADPDAVRHILRNLLDNALRYAPEGSEVRLALEAGDGELRVAVTDSGPGIPSAHLSRIFERFYRVDPARSREAGGTGLGLSIVKHLVSAHGGRAGVESEVGRGTTVWFTLPAAEPALAAVPRRTTGGS